MKLLVVGSLNYEHDADTQERFENACRELGAAAAGAGFELVIGSSHPKTADKYFLEGAATIPGTHKVWIYRPDQGETPQLPPVDLSKTKLSAYYKRLRGPFAAGRLPQMQSADAVILIGGARGTAQVGYVAMALGKPALSIGCFKGAAEELWPLLEPFYQRVGPLSDEIGNMRDQWQPGYAETAIRAIRELVRKGAFKQKATGTAVALLALNILLFTSWVWLFVSPVQNQWQASIFALLAVSAFLGTGLRTASKTVFDASERNSVDLILAELSTGLLLAFALAMLYLAGSFTFTGKFQPFSGSSTLDDYQRVAVGMTLIGIAGGWLLERVTERLTHAFGEQLANGD